MTSTKARKPTKRQREVLEVLAEGQFLWLGGRDDAFTSSHRLGFGRTSIHPRVVWNLKKHVLIEHRGRSELGMYKYTITPAERRALNES